MQQANLAPLSETGAELVREPAGAGLREATRGTRRRGWPSPQVRNQIPTRAVLARVRRRQLSSSDAGASRAASTERATKAATHYLVRRSVAAPSAPLHPLKRAARSSAVQMTTTAIRGDRGLPAAAAGLPAMPGGRGRGPSRASAACGAENI